MLIFGLHTRVHKHTHNLNLQSNGKQSRLWGNSSNRGVRSLGFLCFHLCLAHVTSLAALQTHSRSLSQLSTPCEQMSITSVVPVTVMITPAAHIVHRNSPAAQTRNGLCCFREWWRLWTPAGSENCVLSHCDHTM